MTSCLADPPTLASTAPQVGGLIPYSSVDYPGELAIVVFIQGCPWRCGYCHNPHLQPRHEGNTGWQEVENLMQRRQGLIDAVVFSGGEPTLDPGLPAALRMAKQLGYKTGLHSGGIYPDRLRQALPWLDWVGMDIKAPFDRYDAITGRPRSATSARASLELLLNSNVTLECRSTIHPALHTPDEIWRMASTLASQGVRHYALQLFRPDGCRDDALNAVPLANYPGVKLTARIEALFDTFSLRRG